MTNQRITRNLQDQSANFGIEAVVSNRNGERQFVDASTGRSLDRAVMADRYDIQNSPLDGTFQLNPQSYNISKALFEQRDVPTNLSNTFGAITAVTAKDQGVGANKLFQKGIMSSQLLENVNFFRTQHSQIGVNSGASDPPYNHNLMLGAKIYNQIG